MSSTQLYHQIVQTKTTALCVSFRRPETTAHSNLHFPPSKTLKYKSLALNTNKGSKWATRLSLVEQSLPKSTVDVERLVGFLYEDLPHLFDDQGIDRTAYDERVKFRDPITKHDTISGYLFNISLLKILFRPDFMLHWVKQVCPFAITTILFSKYWILELDFIII